MAAIERQSPEISAVGGDGSYPAKASRRAEWRVAGLPSGAVGGWGMMVYNLVYRHDSCPVGQRLRFRVTDGGHLEGLRRWRLVGTIQMRNQWQEAL